MADNYLKHENEEWRAVVGYPGYQVSNHGRIKSFIQNADSGKIVSLIPDPRTGYLKFTFKSPGVPKRTTRVHRIVCEAFHGPASTEKPEVAHRDGTRDNNHFANLRWASRKENVADQIRDGTFHWAPVQTRKK